MHWTFGSLPLHQILSQENSFEVEGKFFATKAGKDLSGHIREIIISNYAEH